MFMINKGASFDVESVSDRMSVLNRKIRRFARRFCLMLVLCVSCAASVALAVKDEDVDWTDEGKRRVNRETMGGTYDEALAFFKDKDHFVFSFRIVEDSKRIHLSSNWAVHYITRIYDHSGREWKVHQDAIPNYRMVFEYLENVHFRVSGTNGDTGILPLEDCIYTYDGSYSARWKNSAQTVLSHHSFGTATDLNAKLLPNRNGQHNIEIIDHAVRDHLVYNGIVREDGRCWYDFTYTGDGEATHKSIPDDIINYLLYELAFYRAGFIWGHYYQTTSDAMHFSLTEPSFRNHADQDGLRKVFEYAED